MQNTRDTWQGVLYRIKEVHSPSGRDSENAFPVEGTRLVERALRCGAVIEDVLVSATYAAKPDDRTRSLLAALSACDIRIAIAPDAVLDQQTGGRDTGHILARIKRSAPSAPFNIQPSGRAVWIVAVDILDPGNMGAIVRSCHAGGAAGLIATGTSDPWHPKAVRTSMGSIFKLAVYKRTDAETVVSEMHNQRVQTIAADCNGPTPLAKLQCRHGPLAVFIGSEAHGLSPGLLAIIDDRICIPMAAGVDSFSVNAAAAIILYELCLRSRN